MANLSPWLVEDTYELLGICEQIKDPATYLVDTFFPHKMPASHTDWVSVEYRKAERLLSPYVVKGSKGVNINRGGSRIKNYKAPMIGPRRVIGLGDIEQRQFGEQPIFSTVTPEERAARMLANDLVELKRMNQNTKAKQAADILQTGKMTIRGYADDGKTGEVDEIDFEWTGKFNPLTKWSEAGADIYGDLKAASERIQEDSGYVPTLMLCGRNVENYLLNNDTMSKWLAIPNRENLTMMSFAPRYTSPQSRFIGHLSSLNLEIISYTETYTDDDGIVKPFIDPDNVIICNPGRGRQLFGAITFMNQAGQWQTAAAEEVPVYLADPNAQQSSLALFSRVLLVPETLDDHICIQTTTLKDGD